MTKDNNGRKKGYRTIAEQTRDAYVLSRIYEDCAIPLMADVADEYRLRKGGEFLEQDADEQRRFVLELGDGRQAGARMDLSEVDLGDGKRNYHIYAGKDLGDNGPDLLRDDLRAVFDSPADEVLHMAEMALPSLMLLNYRFSETLWCADEDGRPQRNRLVESAGEVMLEGYRRLAAKRYSLHGTHAAGKMLGNRTMAGLPYGDIERIASDASWAFVDEMSGGEGDLGEEGGERRPNYYMPTDGQTPRKLVYPFLRDGLGLSLPYIAALLASTIDDLVPSVNWGPGFLFVVTGMPPRRLSKKMCRDRDVRYTPLFTRWREGANGTGDRFRWPCMESSDFIVGRALTLAEGLWDRTMGEELLAAWRDMPRGERTKKQLDKAKRDMLRNAEPWRKAFAALFVDSYVGIDSLGREDLEHRKSLEARGLACTEGIYKYMDRRRRRSERRTPWWESLGVDTYKTDSMGRKRERSWDDVRAECVAAVARDITGVEPATPEDAAAVGSWSPLRLADAPDPHLDPSVTDSEGAAADLAELASAAESVADKLPSALAAKIARESRAAAEAAAETAARARATAEARATAYLAAEARDADLRKWLNDDVDAKLRLCALAFGAEGE